MLKLSPEAIVAKNTMSDDGSFLLFIKIVTNNGEILRFVKNSESLQWQGETWNSIAILDTSIEYDNKGKIPEISLTVSNIDRGVQNYVETDSNFGSGWEVTLYTVYSKNIDSDTPEVEMKFFVKEVTANEMTVTFKIGMPNPTLIPIPTRRCVPNYCQAIFKDDKTGCLYTGTDELCDKTYDACKEKFSGSRTIPFVAFPSMPNSVLMK